MKLITKLLPLCLCLLLAATISSCDKDVCYECDTYENSGITVQGDTYCESTNISEDEVVAIVELHEGRGATCRKK